MGFGCCTQLPAHHYLGDKQLLTEKEIKFKLDLNALVIRALRAGATLESVRKVMNELSGDLDRTEPYLKASLERDLAP